MRLLIFTLLMLAPLGAQSLCNQVFHIDTHEGTRICGIATLDIPEGYRGRFCEGRDCVFATAIELCLPCETFRTLLLSFGTICHKFRPF